MSAFSRLKAYITGEDANKTAADLQAASIPVSEAECRGCANPCDEGHEEYPAKFDVDLESELLGSVKPYSRQVVISTGKSDWPKEVTEAEGTLAAFLSSLSGGPKPASDGSASPPEVPAKVPVAVAGVFDSADLAKISKVTFLNGSHRTVCEDEQKETVLVFPDYKVVTGVDRSPDGAEKLWRSTVSPDLHVRTPPAGGSELKTWILPYSCVIMLCSHKRRDNRCAIAAPKLESTFMQVLEREGWEVHTQVEDSSLSGPPLEELTGTEEEKQAEVLRQLKNVDAEHSDAKRVLILRNSHVGGHKFAGNVIINTPRGVSVWYGRVTPHEVEAIVKETIVGGKILPPLLRGGLNLSCPGHASLNDW
ncbi:Altered inheritance of mitochondria protein 32 [Grifola frondosa]|uniref:Altered inheritance of mitochondria protein 32 n=1 Tax=Grifola frondosa TaxID=5627 RepID=A0A1C7LZJ4_GRIFR|nr:Altered inheritance of mitochondria protein 32 [Grifola frondosa]